MSTDTVKADTQKGDGLQRWEWREPTDDEFEKNRVDKNLYRIFSVDKDGNRKTLYKFWAKNDEEALNTLEEFKSQHAEFGECYYGSSGNYVDGDGKRHDSLREMHVDRRGTLERIWDYAFYRIPSKFVDFKFKARNVLGFIHCKHACDESWNLDLHILEDLKYNLPILAKHHHGYPNFIADRVKGRLDRNGLTEREFMKLESETASKMWTEELLSLHREVLLYLYYSNHGMFDDNDMEMASIDREYRNTIPYKEGTYKEIDCAKLGEMTQEHWNNIWDWVKEKGQALWD